MRKEHEEGGPNMPDGAVWDGGRYFGVLWLWTPWKNITVSTFIGDYAHDLGIEEGGVRGLLVRGGEGRLNSDHGGPFSPFG